MCQSEHILASKHRSYWYVNGTIKLFNRVAGGITHNYKLFLEVLDSGDVAEIP